MRLLLASHPPILCNIANIGILQLCRPMPKIIIYPNRMWCKLESQYFTVQKVTDKKKMPLEKVEPKKKVTKKQQLAKRNCVRAFDSYFQLIDSRDVSTNQLSVYSIFAIINITMCKPLFFG